MNEKDVAQSTVTGLEKIRIGLRHLKILDKVWNDGQDVDISFAASCLSSL